MLFALSSSHEIGLAIVGSSFILFALASSFLFPRFVKDFPTKKGLRWYLPLSAAFFIVMMSAVLIFGKEKVAQEGIAFLKEKAAKAAETTPATEPATGKLTSGPYANGDATAGKAEFTTAGCGACHTFKAAGSTGKIGPSLDAIADDAGHTSDSLGEFTLSAIIKPPPAYVPPGYAQTMPTTFGSTLTKKQIADLVAFIDDSVGS